MHGLEEGIFGIEGEDTGLAVVVNPFEGGFAFNEDGGDLAIFDGVLLADKDDVSIVDAGANHGISLGTQAEIGMKVGTGGHEDLDVFIGQYRLTAGDLSQQGELFDLQRQQIGDGSEGVGAQSRILDEIGFLDAKQGGQGFDLVDAGIAGTLQPCVNGGWGSTDGIGDLLLGLSLSSLPRSTSSCTPAM